MRRTLALLVASLLLPLAARAEDPSGLIQLPGMKLGGTITRDANGIASVFAFSRWDLFFLEGYLHAEDRFFQMDTGRRSANGTLAELLGPAALGQDVQLRTLGFRRAADATYPVLADETREALVAYSAGVNAWLAANPLPPEYKALELTAAAPWTPLDTIAFAKLFAWNLSFDLDTTPTITLLTYQAAGQILGVDGTKLFFEDLFRSAPFDPFTTIPVASGRQPGEEGAAPREDEASETEKETFYRQVSREADAMLRDGTLDMLLAYHEKIKDLPAFQSVLRMEHGGSSNEWAISGPLTTTGNPIVCNDPHLTLSAPAIWYPIALRGPGYNVSGNSIAGAPFIIVGENEHMAWGATVHPMDVTDTFKEQVVPVPTSVSPVGYATLYMGNKEPLAAVPETFRTNHPGNGTNDDITVVPPSGSIPPATVIVPRRNNGPVITPDTLASGSVFSVQYTGWGPTHELDAVYRFNRAKNLDEFKAALQLFDFGSQNWAVADDQGNIAYLTSAENPIREDLNASKVTGLPPYFIRSGTGGNEWLKVTNPQPSQALPYEILPYSEMPQVINPAAGWFANGNNDPVGVTLQNNPLGRLRAGGKGIYYLNPYYAEYRGGRIAQMIRAKLQNGGKISLADVQKMQGDSVMIDAQYFVPFIVRALANAKAAGADPVLAQFAAAPAVNAAVGLFSMWDFSTPTGLKEAWDFGKPAGVDPTPQQVGASVAATFYAGWRSAMLANTIDGVLNVGKLPVPPDFLALSALRNLFDNFATRGGRGASGVNFFNVPVARAEDRRDIIILKSVADALQLFSSDAFAAAFNKSVNPLDYRWGKLHRIVFSHPLGSTFSFPIAGGAFPATFPNLPGISRQGGFEVVDRSDNSARASTVNGFMFDHGPSRRFSAEVTPAGPNGHSSLPGGVSGVLGSPHYVDLLPMWLQNGTYDMTIQTGPKVPWL